MVTNTKSTALVLYTPPISTEEFIRKEVGKTSEPSATSVSLVSEPTLFNFFFPKTSSLEDTPSLLEPSIRVSSAAKLDGNKIAEALQSQFAITQEDDERPVVATYGCGPCVALGGYDPANKIAFVVHFANAEEVGESSGLIFWNIGKLIKKPITKDNPMQLHLRGGYKGESESIIEAIKIWMRERDDLPMEVVSEDILADGTGMGKSLSVDSRTGKISTYTPLSNTELDPVCALMSAYKPKITLAYSPK